MIVYHGSTKVITTPVFNWSKRTNDYGYGFYTTENIELAKEWACSDNKVGIVNIYEADMSDLKIMNLNGSEYNILNWLAILVRYRTYWQKGSVAEEAKKYLQDNPDVMKEVESKVRGILGVPGGDPADFTGEAADGFGNPEDDE